MRVGPLFGNTLGHCVGLAVFSLLSYLFLIDWIRSERPRSGLSAIAAALGLVWNVGDLLALDAGFSHRPTFHVLHAIAVSSLTFLPALLLHIWLQLRDTYLWIGGYFLSLAAALLQIRVESTKSLISYQTPFLLVAIGFNGLTIICLCQSLRQGRFRWAGAQLAVAMLLLLPAIFLVSHHASPASQWHQIAIPLSIFVLLFDFRFLVLDVLLRLFLRTILIAGCAVLCFFVAAQFHFVVEDPFRAALSAAVILGGLLAIIQLSAFVDRLTAWFVYRRSRLDPTLSTLHHCPVAEYGEDEYLAHARCAIENFFQCAVSESRDLLQSLELQAHVGPMALLERSRWSMLNFAWWAEIALPLRFANGDGRLLLLGPRRGQRPYRQEDISALRQFGKIIEEHIERRRQLHTQALASHAELRALQAQINPHFFFNSLNTLYAVISCDNVEAKRLVLNLSEVFHYLLRSDCTFVSLKQELAIINAYLEIEKLRLGPRLTTLIEIDDHLLDAEIPVLCIEPLVENAVRHGVAQCSNNGFVGLTVKSENARLKIEITNTGKFASNDSLKGTGVGLENVQRRLALCYGLQAEFHICSTGNLTVVCCSMPLSIPVPNGRPKPISEIAVNGRAMVKTA